METISLEITLSDFPTSPPPISGTGVSSVYYQVSGKEALAKLVLNELGFEEDIRNVALQMIKEIEKKKSNVSFSKSSENEFIIYQKTEDQTWKNLLIDEDGDIELIVIPKNKRKTFNQHFFLNDSENYKIVKIASRFNEL